MIVFPTLPSDGQLFQDGPLTFIYDADREAWFPKAPATATILPNNVIKLHDGVRTRFIVSTTENPAP